MNHPDTGHPEETITRQDKHIVNLLRRSNGYRVTDNHRRIPSMFLRVGRPRENRYGTGKLETCKLINTAPP